MMIDNILDNDKMSIEALEHWIENYEEGDIMPDHVFQYQDQLDLIRGWSHAGNSPGTIKRKLRAKYPGMSETTARERFSDAVTYFHLNPLLRKEAYSALVAEKQMQLAEATLKSATEPAHYEMASRMYLRAEEAYIRSIPEMSKVPEELLERKYNVYSLKAKEVGLPETNKRLLAEQIASFKIEESKKHKLLQDLGEEPREVFNYEELNDEKEN